MGGKVRSGVTEYVVLLLIGLETCSVWITDMDRYCGSIQQGQGQGQEHYCVQHAVATESTPQEKRHERETKETQKRHRKDTEKTQKRHRKDTEKTRV
jgi:hypothetical protein